MSAEVLVGVTTPTPIQTSNTGGGPSGPSATNTNTNGITSGQTSETENINNLNSTPGSTQNNSSNNTISAAADSSDNQRSTPQPHLANNNMATQTSAINLNPYNNQIVYGNTQQAANASNSISLLGPTYPQNVYTNMDSAQQHQQLQQHITSTNNQMYQSFHNSFEQFYQQQQQQNPAEPTSQNQNPQQMDFINSNTNPLFSSTTSSADYKQQTIVRYHPYLQTPTSGIPNAINSQNSNTTNAMDGNSQATPVVSAASSSVMSPRVASSTSPSSSSNQMQISGSASSIGSMSVGNPSSPNSAGSPQCKKCGIMCTNDSELQEHITNVHAASPYGSSGYSGSPYIKDDMQQQTPPSQNLQQQPPGTQQGVAQSVNPGDILDLDSQKLLYPPGAMAHTNLGNTTDPLHGLHNMQQRAGINTWDPQSQQGLPGYLQQQPPNSESKNLPNHSTFYQSPKQSPYSTTNSATLIKTEYQPIIKSEYAGDANQYSDDKSFDPNATNQQQQMMPPALSSSPAEFPTTTTGGPQDNQQQNVANNQQFRGGNFEPPSSSSANISGGPIGTKAANWKSNEARRPKTYNCTACNKWFTSSGHLKRHYNTTLHKNAVKSSGQPDPATLPISAHHHPARDPNGKTGRGRASNAAANSANNNAQQQQQPPNPVQPPEPPNSPQGYGGSQVATTGLTPLPHYTTTTSPNMMYDHQQYQYVPQMQSTTNAASQHATSMSNHHLLANQQQQTVLNGHPNELAGLSVPTTVYQQQTPMPPSQLRGLLNTLMPILTVTKTLQVTKNEHLEAATMEDPHQAHEKQAEEFDYLQKVDVKREYSEEMEEREQCQGEYPIYIPKAEEQISEKDIIQQQIQSTQALREADHNVQHHHNEISPQIQHYQLDPAQQEDMDHLYHHITPNNTPVPLPPIISHQLYPAQHQQLHQTVDQDTFTLMQTRLLLQQQHNIMDQQQYINILSDTNMPPSNMPLLQPQLTITEQDTTIHTNMVSIQPLNHHHTQQQPLQHMELQQQVNMSQQLDTINTSTRSHTITTTTTNNITSTPSYQQQEIPDSVPPQLEHTLTSPPTIIGNAEIGAVNDNGNIIASSHQQDLQISGGRVYQQMPTAGQPATAETASSQCYSKHLSAAQKSPTAGDLPPLILHLQQETITTGSFMTTPDSIACLPTQENIDPSEVKYKGSLPEVFLDKNLGLQIANEEQTAKLSAANNTKTTSSNKRTRNYSSSSSLGVNSTVLPSGRIKCLPCDKEFTKMCYLTQHNNSFHSGEYPYRCQKCGKRYQIEEVYKIHLNKHRTTDKAHKCELCPKQFHHKTDLRRHIEAIHTGNKQHSCDICEKSFCRKDHLRKHLETHNRARILAKKNQDRSNVAAVPRNKKTKVSADSTASPITNQIDFNQNELSASAANNSTTLPLLQHYDDVRVEELLEKELSRYDLPQMELSADGTVKSRKKKRAPRSSYILDDFVVIAIKPEKF